MRIHILCLIVLTALATQLTGGRSEKITIVNETSYDIQAAWLAPACDEGEGRVLPAGKSLEVSYPGQHQSWDLYLGWNDDEEEDDEFSGLTPGRTYAVVYDEDSDVTSLREI